jgi:hypothetical protein
VKFDLGIHDVDLYFYLVKQKVNWTVHIGYGKQRREIIVHLKNNNLICFDLLNKIIDFGKEKLNLSSFINNPILEMINDINCYGYKMNENWSSEISIIERSCGNTILLGCT